LGGRRVKAITRTASAVKNMNGTVLVDKNFILPRVKIPLSSPEGKLYIYFCRLTDALTNDWRWVKMFEQEEGVWPKKLAQKSSVIRR
jgi:hypothetical protein